MPFRKQLLPLQILPAPQHEPWEYSTPAHRDGDYSPKHDIATTNETLLTKRSLSAFVGQLRSFS